MAETKVIYHGTTVYDATGQGNPPPYSAGPPPPGPYPPQPQYAGPTVVQATVVPAVVPVVVVNDMGSAPARVTCKSCKFEVVTRTTTRPSLRTHLFASLLCLVGLWPCVCLPYCVDSCMRVDHNCPNCNSYIGSNLR